MCFILKNSINSEKFDLKVHLWYNMLSLPSWFAGFGQIDHCEVYWNQMCPMLSSFALPKSSGKGHLPIVRCWTFSMIFEFFHCISV